VGTPSIDLIDATNANALSAGSYHFGTALSVARLHATAVQFNNGGTPAILVAGGDPAGAGAANGTHDVIVTP
jgi:hypothetical protein